MTSARRALFCVATILCVAGCGSSESSSPFVVGPTANLMITSPNSIAAVQESSIENLAAERAKGSGTSATIVSHGRRIIYNTQIRLVVESFDGLTAKIIELAEQSGGFIASAALSGASGEQRSGSWSIRVPVEQYRAFLKSAEELGEVTSSTETTREVTAEYFDIAARIRNKTTEEQRLIVLLGNRSESLQDVLTVEKEITRVRGEVEQLQGRLRVLADQTDLSTVRLDATEVTKFVPQESPSFGTQMNRQWNSTLDDLASTGEGAVLRMIRVGPWLLLILVPGIPLWLFVRRRILNRRMSHTAA